MGRKKKEIEPINFTPSVYQKNIFDYIEKGNGNLVVEAAAGCGKCLGKGTQILMYDGSVKKVENIKVGDLLMGDDSTPRTVLSTTQNRGELKKIVPNKGQSWVCNDVHILTLMEYSRKEKKYHLIDIPINELEKKVSLHKNGTIRNYTLRRSAVDFDEKETPISPYLYGYWLGDGTTSATIITCGETDIKEVKNILEENIPHDMILNVKTYANNKTYSLSFKDKKERFNKTNFSQLILPHKKANEKWIDERFLFNSKKKRRELLAGLLDSDGYSCSRCPYYEIAVKGDRLAKDILFLCRSLGLAAYDSYRSKKCYNNGTIKKYHIISISGDFGEIPIRLERKKALPRKINKDVLNVGFKIENLGIGDYYGFTLDGNGRFLLDDLTITHNTSTLIQALNLIPSDKNILFCAFNKDIVTELEKKVEKKDNILISTIHSLGLRMLTTNFKGEVSKVPNASKYRSHISNYIKEYSSMNLRNFSRLDFFNYLNNINSLVQLLRLNLIDNAKDAQEIVTRHDFQLIGDEVEVALDVMEWGKNNIETIDYTDMLWLPNVLYLKPYGLQFDYVFVDECQDLNTAQRELIFKCQKMGTRYIFVGDRNQAIYAFSGASPEAFDFLKTLPNTISLPLSISYRCPKRVVRYAQMIVPSIEYKEDAKDGEIAHNVSFEDVADGDMILCRNNAPLMKLYSEFLKLDKKCFIRGKDIGKNLIAFASSTKQEELNVSLNKDGVFLQLYKHFFETRNRVMTDLNVSKKDAYETTICSEMLDKIKALEILSENINTLTELTAKIKSIFSDSHKKGISLSTVHKAKGLEANNVYIACPSLMPSKSAKQEWQHIQERNLQYVAYTRAKNKLGFLNEDIFKHFSEDENKFTLDNIERKIDLILNKNISTGLTINKDNFNRIIKQATPIRETNVKSINNHSITRQPLSLGRRKISQIKKEIFR